MSTASGTVTYKLGTLQEYNHVVASAQATPGVVINNRNSTTLTIRLTISNLQLGSIA